MDTGVVVRRGETQAHLQLKRLAALWAQANGYSACASEISLPRCRYRADVAAYRPAHGNLGVTAIFECKQALPDLRRDNCFTDATRTRLQTVHRRRELLEKYLRIHYPTLRGGETLFPEFDLHDFGAIGHRTYTRVTRELTALQNRLNKHTKFECLVRYRCANLFFLVLPNELFHEAEAPIDWGVLVESGGALNLSRRPVWHENAVENRLRFLQRIAAVGTRHLNRQLGITHDEIAAARAAFPGGR
ncbi:MAG: hypothetical protein ACR2MF_09590 [Chthoniobacterales bacterium]